MAAETEMTEDKNKLLRNKTLLFTHLEFVFKSFEEVFFALSLLLFLLLLIVLLQLSGANDQVELGHGDHPWVTVRPVEGDLQSDLSNEAWNKTRECTNQGRKSRINSSKTILLFYVLIICLY